MTGPSVDFRIHLQRGRDVWRRFAGNESGSTAVEYAVLASAIGAGIAGGVVAFGAALKTGLYDRIAMIFS
jgi:Flp pilus assembly pilin Flp